MMAKRILGIILIIYAIFTLYISMKKPEKMWARPRLSAYKKILGEKGSLMVFKLWGFLALIIGAYLLAQ